MYKNEEEFVKGQKVKIVLIVILGIIILIYNVLIFGIKFNKKNLFIHY